MNYADRAVDEAVRQKIQPDDAIMIGISINPILKTLLFGYKSI